MRPADRLRWCCLRRWWRPWKQGLVLVQPATVARWHRVGLRWYWRRRSGHRLGRPRIDADVQALIRRLAMENRLWGAPRLHGELLKFGIAVSERTVSRYLADTRRAPSQTWQTFLANHVGQLAVAAPIHLPGSADDHDMIGACEGLPDHVSLSAPRPFFAHQRSHVPWPTSRSPHPLTSRVGVFTSTARYAGTSTPAGIRRSPGCRRIHSYRRRRSLRVKPATIQCRQIVDDWPSRPCTLGHLPVC